MASHNPETDRIARHAARLVMNDEVTSIPEGVSAASAHITRSERTINPEYNPPLPSTKLVREHLRAMSMQTLGADGYAQKIREVLQIAEEIMTACEENADPHLVGRGARGYIDGGVTLYIRAYTSENIGNLADRLVSFGYEEPKCTTAHTKFGKLDRLTFEENKIPVVITRCPPTWPHHIRNIDLFTGRPIATITLRALRNQLDNASEITNK